MLIASIAQSQLTLLPPLVSAFSYLPAQVMSVTVSNASSDEIYFELEAQLSAEKFGLLYTARSISLKAKPGITQIDGKKAIETTEFNENSVSLFSLASGALPTGQYQLCYRITSNSLETPITSCFQFYSDQTSFLNLTQPLDKSTIDNPMPLLCWTHSGPLPSKDPNESFSLVLVEKFADQSAAEALSNNQILARISNLTSHTVPYPLGGKTLEYGKAYAWQVIHYYNEVEIELSEAWTFQLDLREDPRDYKYVDLTSYKSGTPVTVYQSLYFRFDERYNSNMVDIALQNTVGNEIEPTTYKDDKYALEPKKNGFNGYRINFQSLNLKPGIYVLKMMDGKGMKYEITIDFKL
jgi:hypothetical protein